MASIRAKFSSVFVITLLVCTGAAATGVRELSRTRVASWDLTRIGVQQLTLAQRLETQLYRAEVAEDRFLTGGKPADLDLFHGIIAELQKEARRLRPLLSHPEARAQLDALLGLVGSYAELVSQVARITTGGAPSDDPTQFRGLLVKRRQVLEAAKRVSHQGFERALSALPGHVLRVEESFASLTLWLLAIAVTVALGATSAWVVGGGIVRQVGTMARQVREITLQRQLDRRIEVTSGDEVGVLAGAFNSLLEAQQASILDLKRSQQRLIDADKLATIGQLSAGVAHEINNPLAAVAGNVQFVQDLMGPVLKDLKMAPERKRQAADLSESLADVQSGLTRIGRIVAELSSFSRRSPALEQMDITEVLEVALKMANHVVKDRARVVRDFQPAPTLQGDRGRLQQVFLNLLVNAAQAIPAGTPEAQQIRVAVRAVDEWQVAVDVSDSGGGISPEHLAVIFDPFFTTKGAGEGTGLGLAITRDIIAQHGGTITVQSQVGKGTTFTVTLPTIPPLTRSGRLDLPVPSR
jgi:signal transduction histidine kinase